MNLGKMNNIKYIFFDIGYILINDDKVWKKRCLEQSFTEEAKESGLTSKDIYNEIVKASLAYKPQYRTVAKSLGFKVVVPYPHEFETLYGDTQSVLEKLSEKYKLGVIANQTQGLCERLDSWGIFKYFSSVISSWEARVMKPDKKIFEFALEKAGCVP